MAQTKMGAKAAKKTAKQKYGLTEDGKSLMHSIAGKKGGSAVHTKPIGFSTMTPEQRKEAGRKGGLARAAKLNRG